MKEFRFVIIGPINSVFCYLLLYIHDKSINNNKATIWAYTRIFVLVWKMCVVDMWFIHLVLSFRCSNVVRCVFL